MLFLHALIVICCIFDVMTLGATNEITSKMRIDNDALTEVICNEGLLYSMKCRSKACRAIIILEVETFRLD